MITFSEQQRRVPKQMRPVYVVTVGQSQFDRAFPYKQTEDLCIDAFKMAAWGINRSALELKKHIQSAYYGHFADHFGNQLLGEATIHDRLGLDPLPNIGVKTGGATGGSTLWAAVQGVASGQSDCTLAMGWERMDEVPTDHGNYLIACAADRIWETPLGHIYTGFYAPMARRYCDMFAQDDPELFRRVMAEISVKHHGYARWNPFAHAPMDITVQDVLDSKVVAYPLLALDCCLMSVGAACAIICDEETALELTKGTDNVPLRIFVGAGSHSLRVADRRHMEIPLLPNETAEQYADYTERFPGFSGFLAARMAALQAYQMANISNPNTELDLVELHDAFSISDIQTYEDIGIRPYGHGLDYVSSGDCYHTNPKTGEPGMLPSNLSGGLIGCMHAVGATGIMQVNEIAWHLWGRHAEIHGDEDLWKSFGKSKPDNWVDLQVKGAKRGMAISHAGVGSHVTATVLMHPDHMIKKEVSA